MRVEGRPILAHEGDIARFDERPPISNQSSNEYSEY